MGKVILDAATRAKLNGLAQPQELHDEAGAVIGYCLPPDVYRSLLVQWSEAVCPADELDRRAAEPGEGRAAADIFRDLERPSELRR